MLGTKLLGAIEGIWGTGPWKKREDGGGGPSLGEKGEMGEYGGRNAWRKGKLPMAGAGENMVNIRGK